MVNSIQFWINSLQFLFLYSRYAEISLQMWKFPGNEIPKLPTFSRHRHPRFQSNKMTGLYVFIYFFAFFFFFFYFLLTMCRQGILKSDECETVKILHENSLTLPVIFISVHMVDVCETCPHLVLLCNRTVEMAGLCLQTIRCQSSWSKSSSFDNSHRRPTVGA